MKLRSRLFILLFGVVIGFLVPIFFLTLFFAESNFRAYVFEGDLKKAAAYAPLLSQYFARTGSWDGVEALVKVPPFTYHALPHDSKGMHSGVSIHNPDPALDQDWVQERIVILDAGNLIVYDSKKLLEGTRHPPEHLQTAIDINENNRLVGRLLVGTMVDPVLGGFHTSYLSAFSTAMIVAFIVATLLALVMALTFSRSVAGPILELEQATRHLAQGRFDHPLRHPGKDEIAALFQSFSTMRQTLAEADQRKARLLADTAHELRTPVALLRGTLEAIQDGVFVPTPQTLDPLYRETLRLTSLIESLGELEGIHPGSLVRERFDFADLAKARLELFLSAAREKNVEISLSLDQEKLPVLGDRLRLEQVLTNLLSNSLRYTPPGGKILVNAHQRGDELVFSVEDSGPGIPAPEREKVFERLYRLDPSRQSQTGGRGLGLTICREIVHAHNGEIRVDESRLGGAALVVRLPKGK